MAKYHFKTYNVIAAAKYGNFTTAKRAAARNPSMPSTVYRAYSISSTDGLFVRSEESVRGSATVSGVAYYSRTSSQSVDMYLKQQNGSVDGYSPYATCDIINTPASRGNFIEDIVADGTAYPSNGQKDGIWYVRGALANAAPVLTITSPLSVSVKRNESFTITGTAYDSDLDDIVYLSYAIGGGIERSQSMTDDDAGTSQVSLKFSYDGESILDARGGVVVQGAHHGKTHDIVIWAKDSSLEISNVITVTVSLIRNQAPVLTVNPFVKKTTLTGEDSVKISGTVADADGDTIRVLYKLGASDWKEVYNGKDGAYSFDIKVKDIADGTDTLIIRARDSFDAVVEKSLAVKREGVSNPLKESVSRHRIRTPEGKQARGVVLWIGREIGDIIVSAEISMTAEDADESYAPMDLAATAFISGGREEDEFIYDSGGIREKIIVKITMKRSSTESGESIRIISGILN